MVKDQLEEVYKANEKTLPKNDAIEVCHPRPKEFTLLTVRLSRETILKGVDFDIITSDGT
jgi:hypothetical protein